MIAKLLTKALNLILSLIAKLVALILTPISAIINAALPDLHNVASTISDFINNHIGNISYFLSWVGPYTKAAIRLELTIISAFFTIYIGYIVIHTTIRLIRKIRGMF